jgi:hypothetical protein
MTHELKTWPSYFKSVWDRIKTFEVRKNDRDFKVGDTLILKEYFNAADHYSGREIEAQVEYILDGGGFGIEKGYCVMSISVINKIP